MLVFLRDSRFVKSNKSLLPHFISLETYCALFFALVGDYHCTLFSIVLGEKKSILTALYQHAICGVAEKRYFSENYKYDVYHVNCHRII